MSGCATRTGSLKSRGPAAVLGAMLSAVVTAGLTTLLTTLLVVAGSGEALGQFEHLAGRIPADANVAVFVNGESIFSSPIAMQQGWGKNRQKMYDSGMAFLPPRAQTGVLAAHLDLQLMLPLWELSLFQFDREFKAVDIAGHTGGQLDKILATPVVSTGFDSYIVPFNDAVVGMMMPADRQKVGRWIRDYSSTRTPALSPYLAEAYHFANEHKTPVVMAMDLQDVVSYEHVFKALSSSELSKGMTAAQIEDASQVIGSLRGVMLGFTVRDRIYGKIRVDFTKNAAPLEKIGKAILLTALAKHGASIDEFEHWEAKVSGNQFTLEGPFDYSGALRISTLLHRPAIVAKSQIEETTTPTPPVPPETLAREASKNYYSKVITLLRDLKVDSRELKTWGNLALWMEKYANRIDQLPVVNVDPELVDYGTKTSDTLRQASSTLRRGLAAGGQAARNVPTQYQNYTYGDVYGYTYRWGLFGAGYVPYGYANTVTVVDNVATDKLRSKVRSNTVNQAVSDARPLVEELSRSSGEIRKRMSTKFGVEF